MAGFCAGRLEAFFFRFLADRDRPRQELRRFEHTFDQGEIHFNGGLGSDPARAFHIERMVADLAKGFGCLRSAGGPQSPLRRG